MNLPSLLFAAILSTLYGAGFHLWRGGGAGKLFLFLILSWAGFASGQYLAGKMNWNFDLYGQTHLVVGSLASLVFLVTGNWLSFRESAQETD
jgi:hypothetical protein